jgi:iron complex transport system permease protein
MGSLQDATLEQSRWVGAVLAVGFVVLLAQAPSMNVFALGEEQAAQLGVDTERFKSVITITGALLTASSVAVAGIIGFVGLVVPHMARRIAGTPNHARVLPLATIAGALLLVWADTIARSIMPSSQELPVGVITAFVGAPFFCYLLKRRRASE